MKKAAVIIIKISIGIAIVKLLPFAIAVGGPLGGWL